MTKDSHDSYANLETAHLLSATATEYIIMAHPDYSAGTASADTEWRYVPVRRFDEIDLNLTFEKEKTMPTEELFGAYNFMSPDIAKGEPVPEYLEYKLKNVIVTGFTHPGSNSSADHFEFTDAGSSGVDKATPNLIDKSTPNLLDKSTPNWAESHDADSYTATDDLLVGFTATDDLWL